MTGEDKQLLAAINDLRGSLDQLRAELVRKDVYEAERTSDRAEVANLVEDVREIKDTMKWLSRTLVASLALPLLSAVLVFYAVRGGAG